MKLFQKKLFFYSAYLTLLLPHTMIGMKRQAPPLEQELVKKQKLNAPSELSLHNMPSEIIAMIILSDFSNKQALKQTCSKFYTFITRDLTLEKIGTILSNSPEYARGVAKNFYVCTQLLCEYAKHENDHKNFITLWKSQSLNDKGIRINLLNILHKTIPQYSKYKPTKKQWFSYEAIALLNQNKMCSPQIALKKYLLTNITAEKPHCVYLALSLPLTHKYLCEIGKKLVKKAVYCSTTMFLELLLDHDINASALHYLLSPKLTTNPFEFDIIPTDIPQKIAFILEYYKQKRSNVKINHNIILDRILSFFAHKALCLDDVTTIIKTLLRYDTHNEITKQKISEIVSSLQRERDNKISSAEAYAIIECFEQNKK